MKAKRMKYLAAATAAMALTAAVPAFAAAPASAQEPVKLTDGELDEVTAGESLLNIDVNANVAVLVQDINVNVDVFVPINVGVIAQVNALGNGTLMAQQFFPSSGG
jgi:hypothetical protein